MKILISCIHYPVASGRYMTQALKRLGHDVRTVGYSSGSQIWGRSVDERYVWLPDGHPTEFWPEWRPELVIHMDSAYAYRHPVYSDVPHVVYGADNHVRVYPDAYAEHLFLAHNKVSLQPMDRPNVTWLPCATDSTFAPSLIPFAERPFDVLMVGVLYEKRARWLDALGHAGLKAVAATGLLFEEYAHAYHQARVSLCVSAASDVAQRIFETAALGCVVVSDPCPDLDDLAPQGIQIAEDAEDAVEQVRRALQHPEVIAASTAWAKPHTWEARAQVILGWYTRIYGQGETA